MDDSPSGIRLHRLATVLILTGFAMLCQPFTAALYTWGFPVLLLGVLLFVIADHLPSMQTSPDQNDKTHMH